ncbi:MAG: outer membrane lipoprotein-sorting protein [Leptospirales bacterium]
MKRWIILFLLVPAFLFAVTGLQIIRNLDQNKGYNTQKYSVKMTIQKGKRTLVKTFTGYGMERGNKSFMEFTNPEDKGVKYLKMDDQLWIYLPEADDTLKISGHMLRQGMMGSDLSYEDMMRDEELEDIYDVKLIGSEKIRGVDCYKVELIAKVRDALYAKQVVYVDKKRPVALKMDLYARGDRLIKTMEQSNVKTVQGRYVPMKIEIRDMRRKDSLTTLEFISVAFNIKIPSKVFTTGNLRR